MGRDVHWKDGKLTLKFEGNRIDAIAGRGQDSPAGAAVLVDGKKPSNFRECYAFTRAYGPGMKIRAYAHGRPRWSRTGRSA